MFHYWSQIEFWHKSESSIMRWIGSSLCRQQRVGPSCAKKNSFRCDRTESDLFVNVGRFRQQWVQPISNILIDVHCAVAHGVGIKVIVHLVGCCFFIPLLVKKKLFFWQVQYLLPRNLFEFSFKSYYHLLSDEINIFFISFCYKVKNAQRLGTAHEHVRPLVHSSLNS